MKTELKLKAIELRKQGYSIKELHKKLGVSKSSISLWVSDVYLSIKAKKRLMQNYTNGQIASQKTIKEKTRQKNIVAQDFANTILPKLELDKNIQAILCSMIYQCEGAKSVKSGLVFTNSDPNLVASFVYLLRNSFELDENKFRVLMHLHSYHNEKIQKDFWAKITKIPAKQFNRTYLKPTNGIYKKEGYQGCIKLAYHDVVLARKFQSIAKTFMERYK